MSSVEALVESPVNITSQRVADAMNNTVSGIFDIYSPTYTMTEQAVTDILNDVVASFPDDFWETPEGVYPDLDAREETDFINLVNTVINSLLVGFNIDPFAEEDSDIPSDPVEAQGWANADLNLRYLLVVSIPPWLALVTNTVVLMGAVF